MTELQVRPTEIISEHVQNPDDLEAERLAMVLYWEFSRNGKRDGLTRALDHQPGISTPEHIDTAITEGLLFGTNTNNSTRLSDHERTLMDMTYAIIGQKDALKLTPEFIPTLDALTTAALYAMKHRVEDARVNAVLEELSALDDLDEAA